jgi:integrase
VVVSAEEKAKLLAAAPPHLRCWLLLCSDLGIRSGTAARLGPENYDIATGVLTFRTKYSAAQQLPATHELRLLLDTCKLPGPFVEQLPRGEARLRGSYRRKTCSSWALGKAFRRLKKDCGIERNLRPHDLRRTTARAVYKATGDLRMVQALLGHSDLVATLWYLQDQHVQVPRSTLELAKLNPQTEVIQ